ncbi:Metallo-dependent phosphatase [Atractiella rhizophila]|nr:Metallo-dependent phosphatase [Atractiella rhizophila]
MVLVLVLGDLHIPFRSPSIPALFRRLLTPGKISEVLSTGNICDRETMEWLAGIVGGMGAVKVVRGGWDESPNLPPSLTVSYGPIRIGVIQGHQAVPLGDTDMLSAIARKMDVDVLISGGTHRFEAFEHEGRFFLNPGSATEGAAPSSEPRDPTPSFALLDIQGDMIISYVYQLVDGAVNVEKIEFKKKNVPPAQVHGEGGIQQGVEGLGFENYSGVGVTA